LFLLAAIDLLFFAPWLDARTSVEALVAPPVVLLEVTEATGVIVLPASQR
jgi:hypothetical protein